MQPNNNPEIINYHLKSKNGKTWRKVSGLLHARLSTISHEDIDDEIVDIFAYTISLINKHRIKGLSEKLHNCKHKLYAVKYHMKAIEEEIEKRVNNFKKQYNAISGVGREQENLVLIYETEAFLFQVKSNLDLMIQALSSVVPSLKGSNTFRHLGERRTDKYLAGGKVIKRLKQSDEQELYLLFETHRNDWIQQLTIWRDIISHYSGLRNFHCFIEEPYRGGDEVKIHYPTMPSGERVDVYCQKTFISLCKLYRSVLKSIAQRIK